VIIFWTAVIEGIPYHRFSHPKVEAASSRFKAAIQSPHSKALRAASNPWKIIPRRGAENAEFFQCLEEFPLAKTQRRKIFPTLGKNIPSKKRWNSSLDHRRDKAIHNGH